MLTMTYKPKPAMQPQRVKDLLASSGKTWTRWNKVLRRRFL